MLVHLPGDQALKIAKAGGLSRLPLPWHTHHCTKAPRRQAQDCTPEVVPMLASNLLILGLVAPSAVASTTEHQSTSSRDSCHSHLVHFHWANVRHKLSASPEEEPR